MTTIGYLGLGTNLGDRPANLRRAVAAIDLVEGISVATVSPVYETEPWGPVAQPRYLNLCLEIETKLLPAELLATFQQIEQQMGRTEGVRWGPRLIDIDVLFYGEDAVEEPELQIPHPRLGDRAFVLAPLADIAPGLRHPREGKAIVELLEELVDTSGPAPGVRRMPLPLEWGRQTLVMGIVNATPDSFSGDGLLAGEDELLVSVSEAVAAARQFVAAGADVIDIGAESTRPGSQPVTGEEELHRLLPVIEAVRRAVRVPISVDTYRAAVAEQALAAGADWINDVWGLRMDPDMADVVAHAGCPIVLMHNRSRPKDVAQENRLGGRYVGVAYDNLIEDVRRELDQSVELAMNAGVDRANIILDPGIGFGKTVSQNLTLIDMLDEIKAMGFPLLVGPSRKSFIGYTLRLPPQERMEGTAAAVAISIERGADIVRVHDVEPIVRVARMTDSIVRKGR